MESKKDKLDIICERLFEMRGDSSINDYLLLMSPGYYEDFKKEVKDKVDAYENIGYSKPPVVSAQIESLTPAENKLYLRYGPFSIVALLSLDVKEDFVIISSSHGGE